MRAKMKTTPVIETKRLPIGGRMLALEPRYVFDAAIATEFHDLALGDVSTHDAAPAGHDVGASIVAASNELAALETADAGAHAATSAGHDLALDALVRAHNLAPSNHEIAFIDSHLADLDTLVGAIPEGTRIVLIDANRDGVAQMVDALRGESGITGIHILSHGSEGHIALGSSSIDANTMSSVYRSALSSIHGNLAAGADILVYGCDFGAGAAGERAAGMLASLTGADVASSTNITGGALGADWTLEKSTGEVETDTVAAADWLHELLDISADDGNNSTVKNTAVSGDLSSQVTAINPPAPVVFTAGTFSTAQGGSVTIQTNGQYTYTPPAGFLGTDTFSFEASATDPNDNITQTATAVETITISPDPGYVIGASGETDTVPYERSFSGTVVDNVTASVKGGPITSYVATSTTANGTLTFNPDGTFSYMPNAGFSGQDSFTFRADDASPDSDPAYATVTFNVETPPLVAYEYQTYLEVNQSITFTPSVYERDGGATLSYAAGTSPDGTLTSNGDGTFTFTPNAGFEGYTAVTYTVTDSNGYQSQNQIKFHYTAAGSGGIAPMLVWPDTYTLRQGDTADQGVAYWEAYSNGVAPVYQITFNTAPAHGTITNFDPNTGWYTYIADPGYIGSDGFSFTVSDQYGQSASSTESINIVPPDLTVAASVKFAPTGTAVSGSFGGETYESAGNTTEVYTVNGTMLTNGAVIATAHGTLTVTDAATGAYSWQPNAGFAGVEVIDWSVKNVWGAGPNDFYETKSSTDTIVSPNKIYAGHDGYVLLEDATKTGTVTAFSGSPNGTPTYTPTFAASHGSATLNADGSYSYTPAAGYLGIDRFGFKIDNGLGNTATGYVTVYMAPPMQLGNNAPTADPIPAQANPDAATPVGVSVASYFTDPDGDQLTFVADGLPPGLVMATDGSISGTIDTSASQAGDFLDGRYSVTVFADDGKGGVAQQTFEWVVTNPAPVANPDTVTTAAVTPVVVPLVANDSDPDGDALTVTAAYVDPAQGSIVQDVGGNWVFTSVAGFTGPATISYTITDADGATASSTHTVVVGPTAVADSYTTPYVTAVNGDAATADVYLPGSTFTKETDPSNGTVTVNANGTYTYTPVAGFTGTDTFTYRVTDPNGLSAVATETIYVGPNAVSDSYTTPYVTAVNGDASTADVYMPGSTFTKATDPSNGTVTLNANGTYTYTPAAGFTGTDTFTYRVTDPNGLTATATETIYVGPSAVADTYSTPFETPVNGDVKSADVYVAGSTFAKTSDPTNGSVVYNADGTYTYTPNAGFTGTDTFTYRVTDPNGLTATATETIYVGPKAVADSYTTPYVTAVNGDASTADVYLPGSTFTKVTDPSNGTVTVNANGTYTYTPAAGFTGTDTFTYRVTDPNGVAATATETILVGPNAIDDSYNTPVGTDLAGDVKTADTYMAGSTFAKTSDPANGSVVFNANGTFTYTPNAGYTGPDSFSYRVTDANGQTATATETIFVNTPPVLVDPDATSGTPYIDPADSAHLIVPAVDNVPISLPLEPYFTDANSDPLTITPDMTGQPAWLVYDPMTHTLSGTPPSDNVGDVTVPVTIQDNHGGTYLATVTIHPVNLSPVANADSVTTTFNTAVVVDLLANDSDPDLDALTVTSATLADVSQGSLTKNPVSGAWTFTPAAGFTGIVTINYTITDVDGATASSTHTVIVGPQAVDDSYTTQLDTPVNGAAGLADTYLPGSTFAATSSPANGSVSMNANGTYTYTPNAGFTGPDTFTYRVTDPNGQSATATETIFVNRAPVLVDPDATAGTPFINPTDPANLIVPAVDNVVLTLPLAPYFSDANGDPLTLAPDMTGQPSWLIYNAGTQTLSGTPPIDNVGPIDVFVTVTDTHGGTYVAKVTIAPANPPPVAVYDVVATALDAPVVVDLLANDTDPDGDPLHVVSASVNPAQGTLAFNGTDWIFTPNAGFTGTATITYTIADQDGAQASSTHDVHIGVGAVDDQFATQVGVPVNGDAAQGDTYSAGSTFTVETQPANGTVTMNANGTFTYTPNAGFTGVDSFVYRVTDSNGQFATATDTITVNQAPQLVDPDATAGTPYIDPTNPSNLIVPAVDNTLVTIPLASYLTDANGDPMTIAPDMTGQPAWLTYDPVTKSLTGTPPVANSAAVVVPVRVTDGRGGSFDATITIAPSNPAPIANTDSSSTVAGTPVIVDLLANDSDPDGDLLTVTSATSPNGTVTQDVNGNWVFQPNAGFSGTATISYTIRDADGVTASSTHTVNVAALAAVDDTYTALYATPMQGDAATGDTFPAGSTFSVVAAPARGSVMMNANGTYTYTPSAGFAGTDTFSYMITDPNGYTVTATETIMVTPPALVAVNDSYTTAFRTTLNGNAAMGDTFAAGSTFSLATNPASGTVTMRANGTYTFTPATNFAGTVTFTYRVTDPVGQVTTAIETIVVSRPRLIATNDSYSVGYGKTLVGNAAAGDTYASGSKFTVASRPAYGTVVMNPNGTFQYVPRAGFSGTDTFTYTITDPTGQKITATEKITVAQRPAMHICLTTFGRIVGLRRR